MSRRTTSQVFVGRQAELGRLDDAFAEAGAGRPSLVLVAGEAGIGKTRFASEFIRRVEAAGATSAVGGCLDVADGGLPYAPFVEAFRILQRRTDPATGPATFGPAGDLFSALVDGDQRPDLATSPGPSTLEDPNQRLARLYDGVIGTLGRLSNDRPLVLVLEDLHWADGSTRDLLRFLVRNLRQERLLLIATYRSDDLHRRHPVMPLLAELARAEHVDRIDLRRFDRSEVEQLLTGILGEAPSAVVGDALAERSDGLPFYIEELVASRASDGMDMPSSLRDILERRLVGLSSDASTLVRTAAVIGGRCSHARLATITTLDPSRLMDAIREAADAGILIPGDGLDGPTYAFRHALLREAAYDDLLPAERVRLHTEMADLLEATIRTEAEPAQTTLADYALHAYLAHDLPRALEGSCRAMSAFAEAVAYREALAHAERAIELWPRVEDAEARAGIDRAHLLAGAGRLAAAATQPARATSLLQEALVTLRVSDDGAELVALLTELQLSAWESEEYGLSRAAAEEAYDLGASSPASRLKVQTMVVLGVERWWAGRLHDSVALLETAMELAERIGDTVGLAAAAGLLSHVLADLGHGVRASPLIDRSAIDGMDSAQDFVRFGTEMDRSIAALTCGRFADAERIAMSAFEQAIRYGLEARQGPHLRGCLIDAMFELGRYADAEAIMQQMHHGEGIPHSLNWLGATMSRVAIAQGRFEEARRLAIPVAAAPDYGHETDPLDHFSYLHLARLELARAERRFADVAPLADAFATYAPTTEAVMPSWQALAIGIGACADEASATRRRRRPADDAIAHADRWNAALLEIGARARSGGGGGPWFDATVGMAQAEMGRLVDRSDPGAWSAIVDQWVALDHPFQTAYSRLRLAEALLRSNGDRSHAERELRSAHASATSIGAALLYDEIDALATDARIELEPTQAPGPDGGTGVSGRPLAILTPRESAVLRLVADGHTNREIGDRLFISEKTVSVHVSNAMAKLGALSRYEAAATAERDGLLQS